MGFHMNPLPKLTYWCSDPGTSDGISFGKKVTADVFNQHEMTLEQDGPLCDWCHPRKGKQGSDTHTKEHCEKREVNSGLILLLDKECHKVAENNENQEEAWNRCPLQLSEGPILLILISGFRQRCVVFGFRPLFRGTLLQQSLKTNAAGETTRAHVIKQAISVSKLSAIPPVNPRRRHNAHISKSEPVGCTVNQHHTTMGEDLHVCFVFQRR